MSKELRGDRDVVMAAISLPKHVMCLYSPLKYASEKLLSNQEFLSTLSKINEE